MEKTKVLATFSKTVTDLINQFQTKAINIVPNIVTAMIIIIGGCMVAFILRFLFYRLISNLDRFISSKTVSHALRQVDARHPAAEVISKVIFWIIIFFTLTVATEVMGLKVVTTWMGQFTNYLPNVLAAVFMGFIGVVAANMIRDLIKKTLTSAGVGNAEVVSRIMHIMIIFITAVIIVGQLGMDIHFLNNLMILIIGVCMGGAALAFGLGSRSIVNNILSSHYLQKTYTIGHHVKISDVEGKIIDITPTAVIIESPRGKVMVPAKEFTDMSSTLMKEG